MEAAIYAGYSSENQSEKSIDDQIRVCKNYCEEHEITVTDEHIYIDEAISGATTPFLSPVRELKKALSTNLKIKY